jgi:ABC-type uncharacterized transport system auxiliary subunit
MRRPWPVLLASLLAGACASKLARTPETFTIDPPPPRAVPAPAATRVLSLRRVEATATYAGVQLVYRVGAHAIDRDPYASFAAPPANLLTAAIRVYLRDTDFIRDVVAPGEGVAVDATIEPALVELAGDFTNPAEPAAVLALHFRVVVPSRDVGPAREVLLKTYTRSLALSQRTAASVVAAWNKALAEIMADFVADLKAALPPPASPG